ncbi:MAG: hypothetical protein ACFE0P_08760 [Oceanicaulis sp.]
MEAEPTPMSVTALAGLAALAFASVHLFSPRLMFLDVTPRSVWLSLSGGISTAYVFLHLLPEIAHRQAEMPDRTLFAAVDREIWVAALLGLTTSYVLERTARLHPTGEGGPSWVFWIHIGAFAAYNLLIGYIIEEQARLGPQPLALYVVALGLHYLVNDRALVRKHDERYRRTGRFILAGATLLGWLLGALVLIGPAAVSFAMAFLSGGVVLNTVKEELPKERESNVFAFMAGAGGYGALLLMLDM